MQYNQETVEDKMPYNQQDMHLVVLRKLMVGESFKVRNGPMENSNRSMDMQKGNWVTVTMVNPSAFSTHHHPIYDECNIPTYHYRVDKSFNSWFDYHMDIYETNLMILRTDRKKKMDLRIKPSLPII